MRKEFSCSVDRETYVASCIVVWAKNERDRYSDNDDRKRKPYIYVQICGFNCKKKKKIFKRKLIKSKNG